MDQSPAAPVTSTTCPTAICVTTLAEEEGDYLMLTVLPDKAVTLA